MSDDDDLSRRIQASMRLTPDPSTPDLGAVTRRARTLRIRHALVASTSALIVLSSIAVPLALLSPLGGRTRTPVGGTPSRSDVGTLALTRVADLPPLRAYYIEGAFAYVKIQADNGELVLDEEITDYLSSWSLDVKLNPGAYAMESYVQPCNGNCGLLEAPTERCSTAFVIESGEQLAATIRYKPGSGCTISFEPLGTIPTESTLPDVAEVVCDDTGTHVLTPEVKPQPDGVHFRVDNQTESQLGFSVVSSNGSMLGSSAPLGVSEPADPRTGGAGWPVPPGRTGVKCRDFERGPSPLGDAVTFDIVDEDGIYVSANPNCGGSGAGTEFSDYAPGSRGEIGDVVELARAYFQGLQEGDVVRLAGYPEQPQPIVAVVRDGKNIATAEYMSDGRGGWLLSMVNLCEAGLRG